MKKLGWGLGLILLLAIVFGSLRFRKTAEEGDNCQSLARAITPYDSSMKSVPQWAQKLNEIPLPYYMQGDSLIDVYFKYNQIVNGYEVTARWRLLRKDYETGCVLMNFHHQETGKDYQFFSEKYNSYDTDKVSFAKDFKGYQNGDVLYFNYTSPDTLDSYKEYNGNSPLGYYTPFQFLDIDFDGNDELFIPDWGQRKGGNEYTVFKPTDDGLQKLDYIPLGRLSNSDIIDLKKKTITSVCFDGIFEHVEFFFSNKERKERIINMPNFYSSIAQGFDFNKYNNELGSPFVLDSIKEFAKTKVEHRESYVVLGNKLINKKDLDR